jgi:peptidoglycan-N-acetylglucosamine deacetylase
MMTAPRSKPAAGLSLDMDNLWSYLKTRGDPDWADFPSYFDRLIPDVLDLFDKLGLKVTFFIVGRDAALPKNSASLPLLTKAGHEVGNHSFHHEPWLHTKTAPEIAREIEEAENAILGVFGRRPLGFRGPGFSWNADLLEILAARGYLYDASTFPTFLGPLGRLYYFAQARLSASQKTERKDLFGKFAEGFRPVRPYRWRLQSGADLLEIPVTTLPLLKTPFHLSYLIYLGGISPVLMRAYFRTALALCRAAGTGLSFLLHPLDFLSREDAPALRFFPGMGIDPRRKRKLVLEVLGLLAEQFEVLPMSDYAARRRNIPSLPIRGVS